MIGLILLMIHPAFAAKVPPEITPAVRTAKSYLWTAYISRDARKEPETRKKILQLYNAIDEFDIVLPPKGDEDKRCKRYPENYAYADQNHLLGIPFTERIVFCRGQFDRRSKEATAGTLVHELIHAKNFFAHRAKSLIGRAGTDAVNMEECETTRLQTRILRWAGGLEVNNRYLRPCQTSDTDGSDSIEQLRIDLRRAIEQGDLPAGNKHSESIQQLLTSVIALGPIVRDSAFVQLEHRPSPLIHAVWSNRPRWVAFLLLQGANINTKDTRGWTASMAAAHLGNTQILKLLIDRRADLNARDSNGITALELARRRHQHDAAEMIHLAISK